MHLTHKLFQEKNSKGASESVMLLYMIDYRSDDILSFKYREKSKPYSHCTFNTTLLTTIMSNERSLKGRITDKFGGSLGKLSRLLRPSASSSMNLNSSSDNYIDAG